MLISNGHGEDLNGGLIADGLRQCAPGVELAALPIVGAGSAYARRALPLLFQGRTLPSGGMVYQGLNIWKDLAAGWLQQSVAQLWTAWRQGRHYDLVVSIGDHVPLIFALLTGRPTVVFLVSTSSFYEGRLRLSALTRWCCRRRRVRVVLTRDAFSARDLQAQGLAKALFRGYPIMDMPPPDPGQVARQEGTRTLALVPGSRFPEALHNLVLMLRLCSQLGGLAGDGRWRFLVAVVESPHWRELEPLAASVGWQVDLAGGALRSASARLEVRLLPGGLASILAASDLVVGMAGTAVEQAVGFGLPVVQLVGRGPQFSYAFAESQMRLLGPTVHTVGRRPAERGELQEAADLILRLLADADLPARCAEAALERVGPPGGSRRIAETVLDTLAEGRSLS
ncbi:lipid-A-disaccharide synthase-related protein [Synechococcus sp. CCY 0621]|uniref:lipid-A-disaccharide synthase-related protein n=1 Tax=Synechococcus sp. CCY 0621 TaxID=2815603 RepID=UPI001C2162E1|nr:lipid-A-disaccharide synthase-related protein [Synechococcus sp. CCY 0621]